MDLGIASPVMVNVLEELHLQLFVIPEIRTIPDMGKFLFFFFLKSWKSSRLSFALTSSSISYSFFLFFTSSLSLLSQRASNGLVWIEQFSEKLRAVIKDYAIGGSTISAALWPSNVSNPCSHLPQSTIPIGGLRWLDLHSHLEVTWSPTWKPTWVRTSRSMASREWSLFGWCSWVRIWIIWFEFNRTMAMISYGINDWAQTRTFGTQNLPKAADELLRQTEKIINSGIRNIVVLCKHVPILLWSMVISLPSLLISNHHHRQSPQLLRWIHYPLSNSMIRFGMGWKHSENVMKVFRLAMWTRFNCSQPCSRTLLRLGE